MTVFQFLSAYIATRKYPAEFPFPTRVLKIGTRATAIYTNSVNWTIYLHYKTLFRDTQKGRPIFYAYPDALQMVVDETISAGRFSHLQGRTFYNGTLYKFLPLDNFCSLYKVASFNEFSIT